jgi:hypothetical protein
MAAKVLRNHSNSAQLVPSIIGATLNRQVLSDHSFSAFTRVSATFAMLVYGALVARFRAFSHSSLFETGLDIPHVAAVSGHRSWQSLKRYTHLR